MKKIILLIIVMLGQFLFAQTAEGPNSTNFHERTIIRGTHPESSFGANVVNVGDFNADGFEDLVISADGENDGIGKVYLYFGGENSDTRPDVVFEAPSGSDAFGYKVIPAGDFNADGFSDILIVAKNYGTDNPYVMIYFGGPNYDTVPDVYLQRYWNVSGYGDDVANLGDVNGDGIDDIGVVTASSIGLYFGSVNPPAFKDMDFSLNQSGYNIEYCGDINGDGYNDILTSNSATGIAFVYKGGPNLDADPDQIFGNSSTSSSFGYSMSGGGDINGDGFSDIIIGDMDYDVLGNAYVYLGNSGILDNAVTNGYPADLTLNGIEPEGQFGSAVAIIKDMNGDGYNEFAVA
jgi:hypothetical protein